MDAGEQKRPAVISTEDELATQATEGLRNAHHNLRAALNAAELAGWGGNIRHDIKRALLAVAAIRAELA
jgi:hypothetical protein